MTEHAYSAGYTHGAKDAKNDADPYNNDTSIPPQHHAYADSYATGYSDGVADTKLDSM
jgi:hypothetical protein